MDDYFRIKVISKTENPQTVIWYAAHQDYSENLSIDDDPPATEELAGKSIVNNLLKGGRGHYGPLEHPQIVFNVGWFPHSTMQQIRTHRVGVSFDVQCLSGDTEVTFVTASGSSEKVKISELYNLWATGVRAIRGRNLRVLNESSGVFDIGRVQDVMCSGQQPVYRLTLADGKTLGCTTNHRLYTSQGWQRMGTALGLVVDDNHKVLDIVKACELMTDREDFPGRPRVSVAHPVKVVSVEYLGIQTTYDLEVEGAWHNFVANGVVVHNSFRYTGSRIIDVIGGKRDVEEVFYLRPLGQYTDRQGKRYEYTADIRKGDLDWCYNACLMYRDKIKAGFSEEHARGLIPFDVRQHWVMSANVRSLMHLLDLRMQKSAQLEAQQLCELIYPHFEAWAHEVAEWYTQTRKWKPRLAP